ncbi:MAG TPA: transglycosylase domain-containing protein [Polyangiales bacterium]|nr:transglycosylase domain-containing protein [Polyangiales bacterium]
MLLGAQLELRHTHELTRLLESVQCAPLSVRDRFDQPVAELRSTCAARGRFVSLRDVPLLLQQLVISSEDSRFELHHGVDVTAVARALRSNLRSLRVVSGASTLTMQLARLLRAAPHTRAWSVKLQQAWDALTLERMLSKPEILEAYFNLAYYGAGAYGAADAARSYFGRELAALDDAELALIALLPRAPELYNLKRHPERALSRRKELLELWVTRGVLQPAQSAAIEATSLRLSAAAAVPLQARHFVDWVVSELPAAERKRGGVLHTTLDLSLQQQAELLVRQHVDKLAPRGVEEAAVVVLDARSAEVRALVGSYAFERSQINAITRRRQLGSLLKPFVYGLAIEAGAAPESVVADVGDVPSSYRSRDWVGREAGPLSYREALAGSYNLAAVHVLERVGVGALHQVLRRAGVAELASAPEAYGLDLALGAARVRLLDVAAGFGFMARSGVVRRATGSARFERPDGSVWRPSPARDVTLFSARTSAQVAGILADPAARHRRFGRGLPLDPSDVDLGEADVALKTGTASGMADLSAILVSSEFIVAAWSGRFDGQPTHGLSGMWGALPLARRVLHAALMGRRPLQVARVDTHAEPLAADSGEHSDETPDVSMTELEPWAERARARLTARIHER